jgi:ribosomal protein S18 acetylase RimI-like enzyme
MKFKIERTTDEEMLDLCARMMSQAEPWITLQRDLDACKESMRGDYKEVYVAADADGTNLLGFIVLQMVGAFKGYIQSICVAPDVRGAGLGSALIAHAEQRIFSVSPNVFMLVSTFNDRAAQLYFRLGYEKIGTLKNFVADGLDEFLLRKTSGSLTTFRKNYHDQKPS